MTNLELGKKVFVWTKGSRFPKWGTIDRIENEWVHIIGLGRTRSQWIPRHHIETLNVSNEIKLISQMFDH